MAAEKMNFNSPVGRWVSGSMTERATEDYHKNPIPAGEGPISFGFAVRKDDPAVNGFIQSIQNHAWNGYAKMAGVQQRMQQGLGARDFAWKIKDGDAPNQTTGQVNPNTAGHWVFYFSTTLPFKFAMVENGVTKECGPERLKRGDFVDIYGSTAINEKSDHTAGIYLNPGVVRLVAYGDAIVGGVSVDEAFKNVAAPTNLPPGASLTPTAPGGAMPVGMMQQQPQPGGMMPGMPQGSPSGYGAQPQAMPGFGQPMPSSPQGMQPGQPMQQPQGFGGVPNAEVQPGQMGFAGTPPGTTAYPSSPQGMPQPGQPVGGFGGQPQGFPAQPGNGSPQTGYPINPATGQPIQPHTGFLPQGGQPPFG